MYLLPSDEAVDWLDAILRFDGTRFIPLGKSMPLIVGGIFRWCEMGNLCERDTDDRVGKDSHEDAVDIGPVDELTCVDFEWILSFMSAKFCWLNCCCCCRWWWWWSIPLVSLTSNSSLLLMWLWWMLLFVVTVAVAVITLLLLLLLLLQSRLFDMIWFALDMLALSTICTYLCGGGVTSVGFVVPLMAAIGLGMLVICVGTLATVALGLTTGIEPIFVADVIGADDDEEIFNLLSAPLPPVFVWCNFDDFLSVSVVLSFFSTFLAFNVSRLPLFGVIANNFCFALADAISGFFKWFPGAGNDDARDVDCGLPTLSFKLKLESLCSLRADDMPLLELVVCFDMCILDERSIFSLLKNFNLSNIECFIVGEAVPFSSMASLACITCWLAVVGILHLAIVCCCCCCCRKLQKGREKENLFRENCHPEMHYAVTWHDNVFTRCYCIWEYASLCCCYSFVAMVRYYPNHSPFHCFVHHFHLIGREREREKEKMKNPLQSLCVQNQLTPHKFQLGIFEILMQLHAQQNATTTEGDDNDDGDDNNNHYMWCSGDWTTRCVFMCLQHENNIIQTKNNQYTSPLHTCVYRSGNPFWRLNT